MIHAKAVAHLITRVIVGSICSTSAGNSVFCPVVAVPPGVHCHEPICIPLLLGDPPGWGDGPGQEGQPSGRGSRPRCR